MWLTGLSGAGKSTIANALEKALFKYNFLSYILDGDNIRHGVSKDLGFSSSDRSENVRRVGEIAKLFVDAGVIVIVSLISPFNDDRENAYSVFANREDIIEVYVKCSLMECENRDPKGLYSKVRRGEIREFTGISSPYEEPKNPNIVVMTELHTVEQIVSQIMNYLVQNRYITLPEEEASVEA